MDEKVMALVGAAAAVTVVGRGLRPVGKLLMRGVVITTEATTASRRGIQGLYDEVKAERERGGTQATPGTTTVAPVAPSSGPSAAAG